MLYKSTPHYREAWGKFSLSVQPYKILSASGLPMSKLEVFNMLYVADDKYQTDLELVAHGMHPMFSLEKRLDLDQALIDQQQAEDLTMQELRDRAVSIALAMGGCFDFDYTVSMMVQAMVHVMENKGQIEQSIKQRVG